MDGLKVVLDCAHGAASGCSPQVFKDAGADVVVIGAEPDGLNINDGVGSTHLGPLKEAVVQHGADLGIAHDGDADRCLAVDHAGNEVDGDQIMAILALALNKAGKLKDNILVATVMSNLGLKIALRDAGITIRETAVGDRYVLEEMRDGGYNLGGEQSGHVIFSDYATTGDGVLTGLQLAAQVALTGRSLQELATAMTKLPQLMINVKGVDKARAGTDEAWQLPLPPLLRNSARLAVYCSVLPARKRWCASWLKLRTWKPLSASAPAWLPWSRNVWQCLPSWLSEALTLRKRPALGKGSGPRSLKREQPAAGSHR